MDQVNKKYGFFQAPVMAFFSADFYQDVARNWRGCGALYLFVLLAGAWAISALCLAVPLVRFASSSDVTNYTQQLPRVKITEGKLSIDKPYPYAMKDPKTGVTYAVFVDEDKTELTADDPPVVITQKYLLTKGEHGTEKTIDFSQLATVPLDFTGHDVDGLIGLISIGLPIGMFLIMPVIYLGHILQLLIYGGVAMAIASMAAKTLKYEAAMRVAAMAITPSVVISTLFWVLLAANISTHGLQAYWGFISIFVTIGYLAFAVIKGIPATPTVEASSSQ